MKGAPEGVAMRDLSADPWEWPDLTAEELCELASQTADPGPNAPIFQYVAVRDCAALRPSIEAGSGRAVLEAVSICALRGLVMPDWLASAFLKRYRAVTHARAASWDDTLSFGRPYPKGTNIQARHKAFRLMFHVYNEVSLIRQKEPWTPIDKGLFERVGGPLGLGATLAEEYYYAAKKRLEMPTAARMVGDALAQPYRIGPAPNTAKIRKLAGRRRPRR